MPIAHVNGADVHYTDTGAPPASPMPATVVFGHGLLFSGWMFADQVEALEDEYRCVTIDWRSQGQSPAARDGHDMDTLTLDLVALLDELGLDAVHYVGLSMGGFVGMRLAARYPDRVLSLTLLNTSAGPEDPDMVPKNKLLANIYRFIGIGTASSPGRAAHVQSRLPNDPVVRAAHRRMVGLAEEGQPGRDAAGGLRGLRSAAGRRRARQHPRADPGRRRRGRPSRHRRPGPRRSPPASTAPGSRSSRTAATPARSSSPRSSTRSSASTSPASYGAARTSTARRGSRSGSNDSSSSAVSLREAERVGDQGEARRRRAPRARCASRRRRASRAAGRPC